MAVCLACLAVDDWLVLLCSLLPGLLAALALCSHSSAKGVISLGRWGVLGVGLNRLGMITWGKGSRPKALLLRLARLGGRGARGNLSSNVYVILGNYESTKRPVCVCVCRAMHKITHSLSSPSG